MSQYVIQKKFMFKDRTYSQGRLLADSDVGEGNIERLAARGFIAPVEKMAAHYEEPPFYANEKDLLTPEQVNRLKKPELLEYAKHIGITNIDHTLPIQELRETVNDHVAESGE